MATLTGNSVASTYKQLLKVTSEGIGADASAKYIEDGLGTDSALSISTTRVGIGTAAPDAPLHIYENAGSNTEIKVENIHASGSAIFKAVSHTGRWAQIQFGDTADEDRARVAYDNDNDKMLFKVNGSAYASLVIDSAGNVNVGGTTNFGLFTVTQSTDTNAGGIGVVDSGNSKSGRLWSNGTNIYLSSGATGTGSLVLNEGGGNVGIGTTAPGQLLDVNSGGGNMIADGYDTHSLAVYKENIEDASGYLDKVLACPAQKWNRKPFVSANEIKEAVLEEFGEDVLIEEAVEAQDAVYETIVVQEAVEEELWAEGDELPEGIEAGDVKTEAQEEETEEQLVSEAIEAKDAVYEKQYSVWDELFPEDNSHRQKALYNMPDGDLKTWIDDWCEAKRVEMRPENKWQKKRLGLVADAELTAEHLPEVVSINDDGEPTGIDTMTYIGILHNAIQELSAKVEALENA